MGKSEEGTLFLVGTPIGNLGDISARCLDILRNVDIVAAEDTRHTLELLNHFEIKNRLVRYDEHTKDRQGDFLLDELRAGKQIAVVSDAGLPGIADPGADLVDRAVEEGFRVVPLPGPNAALTGLIASGLPTQPFFFGGFLPKSKKNRRQQLEQWKFIPATVVLYEAPHRIKEVLRDILTVWENRQVCLARELTKLHEDFWRGSVADAIDYLNSLEIIRGEFVIILAPPEVKDTQPEGDPIEAVQELIAEGMDKKDALVSVAKQYGLPKRELYNRLLRVSRE